MDAMTELQARDIKRQEIIKAAIAAAKNCVYEQVDNTLEAQYMVYKVGGHLLASVLENVDKQLMQQDLLAIGGGIVPPVSE